MKNTQIKQIKLFSNERIELLEKDVNNFLSTMPSSLIKKIKYSVSLTSVTKYSSISTYFCCVEYIVIKENYKYSVYFNDLSPVYPSYDNIINTIEEYIQKGLIDPLYNIKYTFNTSRDTGIIYFNGCGDFDFEEFRKELRINTNKQTHQHSDNLN